MSLFTMDCIVHSQMHANNKKEKRKKKEKLKASVDN